MVKKSSPLSVISFRSKTVAQKEVRQGSASFFKETVIHEMRMGASELKIGILAVQGDFEAHAAMLARLGAESAEVRTAAQLEGCDGLILPGGESTTQLQFLREEGLAEVIEKFAKEGGAIFGTCAGAILLATDVENPKQDSLKLLDMTVLRNAYGRQIASDVVSGPTKLKKEPLEMVFIRGPIIERAGPDVAVLAEYAGKPALVQRDNIMAATFHPELTDDTTVHEHFLGLVAAGTKQASGSAKS
jgi:5'-phosphate synthase pdxT subunit